MRINRLDLTRFGHFKDFSLDFGLVDAHEADLHIVHGPNETGKSTTLAALVELLYGMPKRSSFAFRHEYAALELGAELVTPDHKTEIRRFKNQLKDADLNLLSQSSLDLHGLSRQEYVQRFSFDDESLQDGGESILQNEGDLGAALFSATSGLPNINELIDNAMTDSDRFYDGSNRKGTELKMLRDELKDLDSRRKEIDVQASAWKRLKGDVDKARQQHEAQEQTISILQSEYHTLNNQQQAMTTVRRIERIQRQLEQFSDIPDIPASWLDNLSSVLSRQTQLLAQSEAIDEQSKNIESALAQNQPSSAVLQHADAIDRLLETRAIQQAQQQEIHDVCASLKETNQFVETLQRRLQIPADDPLGQWQIPASLITTLDIMAQESATVNNMLTLATQEHEQLKAGVAQLTSSELQPPVDVTALESYTRQCQNSSPHSQLQIQYQRLTLLETELADHMLKLRPWQGEAAELHELTAPSPDKVLELIKTDDALAHEQMAALNKLQDLQSRITVLKQEQSTLKNDVAVDDPQAGLSRNERDGAWQRHVDGLDTQAAHSELQKTAREFLSAMQSDDVLTERRQKDISEVMRLRQLNHDIETAEQENISIEMNISDMKKRADEHAEAISTLASNLGLPVKTDSKHIERWLQQRENTLHTWHELRTLRLQVDTLKQQCRTSTERLEELMMPCLRKSVLEMLDGASMEEWLALANQTIDRLKADKETYEQQSFQLANLQSDIEARQVSLDKARAARELWEKNWKTTCASCWLSHYEPEVACKLLPDIREFTLSADSAISQQQRLTHLKSNYARFVADSEVLYQRLDSELSDFRETNQHSTPASNADEQCNSLKLLLAHTREQLSTQTRLQSELSEVMAKQSSVAEEASPISSQITDMMTLAQATSTHELELLFDRARQRNNLQAQTLEARSELVDDTNQPMSDNDLSTLSAIDSADLETRIQSIKDQLDIEQQRRTELYHALKSAEQVLETVAGEADVARLQEQRENILLEIETRALDTLRARLGRVAILEGLRRFRELHRSGMMQQARDAFVTITRGNFIDLRTQADEKGDDKLFGVNHQGNALMAEGMSKGTRFQLYLALRIAAYHEYCKQRTPLPFVADDIMETFDDERSAAAFELLANMAKHGQVIYMTHHRHLVDIARSVVGTPLKIHELPALR